MSRGPWLELLRETRFSFKATTAKFEEPDGIILQHILTVHCPLKCFSL